MLVLLLFLVNFGALNGFLASIISSKGSEAINGEITIEYIEGSVFSTFSLNNIEVHQKDSLLLSLQRLQVSYSLSHLLKKEVKMNLIHLKDLKVNMSQQKDSTWNFQDLLLATEEEQKPDTSETFAWTISVDKLDLDSLNANIVALDTASIPSRLSLKLILGFQYSEDAVSAEMKQFYAESHSPSLEVESMTGLFNQTEDGLTWDNFRLKFTTTYVESQGTLMPDSLMASQGTLNISPLDINEFKSWMPDIELYGQPHIQLELKNTSTRNNISLFVEEGIQKTDIAGWFNMQDNTPHFDLNMAVNNLDGAYWTGNPELKSMVNGDVSIKGSGTDYKENSINAQGKFGDVQYEDYELNDLVFHIDKDVANINGDLKANTWFGKVASDFRLKDVFDDIQYDVEALLQEVNLSKLTNNKALYSDLNMKVKTKGKGKKIDSMVSETALNIYQSSFLGSPVNSMDAHVSYNNQHYELSGLHLDTPFVSFSADGKGDVDHTNQLSFRIEAKDIDPLMKAIDQPDISFSGIVDGNLSGPKDSLDINLRYDLANLLYDTISVDALNGEGDFLFGDSLLSAQTDFVAEVLTVDSNVFDKLHVEALYKSNQIDSRINLQKHDSLSLFLDSRIAMKKDIAIHLNEFELNAWENHWKSGSDSAYVVMAEDSVVINHLSFSSGEQSLNIHGTYAFKGNENLEMKFENIDFAGLKNIAGIEQNIHGKLNGNLSLKGTAREPLIDVNLNINRPGMDSIKLSNIITRFGYAADSLFFEGDVESNEGTAIRFDAMMPLHVSLADTFAMPDKNTPIRAKLFLGALDVEMFNSFLINSGMRLNGELSADVSVSNNLGEPHFDGNIGLKNGRFRYEDLGVNYKDITLTSRFSEQKVFLDELSLNSGDGYLKGDGSLELKTAQPDTEHEARLNLRGKDFRAVRSESYNATISPDIVLEGTIEKPVIKGNIKVVRSMINADALLSQFSVKSDNPNPPLLAEALKKKETQEQEQQDTLTVEARGAEEYSFYKNLRGTFDLKIPGNTWVRGKDMNFELQGDLKAIKQDELIDLFGTLNINRGYLKYHGKKFEFERGSITFTGGKTIDPKVDFEIEYDFRDVDRELHTISMHITGRSRQPNFVFYLDDSRIEEREALSYIIFGKSTNQLTSRERGSVDQSATELGASMAIGQISNLVKGSLQKSTGLDVIEFGGGRTWKSGSVKIGKYITDDLYLSYQQTFDFDKKEKTIKPAKVSLEYQIFRSWFLQAINQNRNSGFDVIFKTSWK